MVETEASPLKIRIERIDGVLYGVADLDGERIYLHLPQDYNARADQGRLAVEKIVEHLNTRDDGQNGGG